MEIILERGYYIHLTKLNYAFSAKTIFLQIEWHQNFYAEQLNLRCFNMPLQSK